MRAILFFVIFLLAIPAWSQQVLTTRVVGFEQSNIGFVVDTSVAHTCSNNEDRRNKINIPDGNSAISDVNDPNAVTPQEHWLREQYMFAFRYNLNVRITYDCGAQGFAFGQSMDIIF